MRKSMLNLIIYGTFFKVWNHKSYFKIFNQRIFIHSTNMYWVPSTFQAYDYGKKWDFTNLYCLHSKLMETFVVYSFFWFLTEHTAQKRDIIKMDQNYKPVY